MDETEEILLHHIETIRVPDPDEPLVDVWRHECLVCGVMTWGAAPELPCPGKRIT